MPHSDADEWEEVDGEEAEAVLMELDAQHKPRTQQAAPSADVDQEMGSSESALASASHIALAENGIELRVGSRIIGAREMARYYRQRHRPTESRPVVIAAESSKCAAPVWHAARARADPCVGASGSGAWCFARALQAVQRTRGQL